MWFVPGDNAVLSLSRGEDSGGGRVVSCLGHLRVRMPLRFASPLAPIRSTIHPRHFAQRDGEAAVSALSPHRRWTSGQEGQRVSTWGWSGVRDGDTPWRPEPAETPQAHVRLSQAAPQGPPTPKSSFRKACSAVGGGGGGRSGASLLPSLTPGVARSGTGQTSYAPPSPGLGNGHRTPLPGPWAGSGTGTRKGLGAKDAVGAARGYEWFRLCPQPRQHPRLYLSPHDLAGTEQQTTINSRGAFSQSAGATRPRRLSRTPLPCLFLLLFSLFLGLWPHHPNLWFPIASALPSMCLLQGHLTVDPGPWAIQGELLV